MRASGTISRTRMPPCLPIFGVSGEPRPATEPSDQLGDVALCRGVILDISLGCR
jgi:hypothetical protein